MENRKIWMFPRNKRTCYPTEVGLMMRALANTLFESGGRFDQTDQDRWIQILNKFDLKAGADLRHSSSGGARTYVSYFSQLGLIFDGKEAGREGLNLTLAGEQVAELKDPHSVVRLQVLRTQFPSPYSIGPNVGICQQSVKLRPALFVWEMMKDKRLEGYFSNEDLTFACIYGQKMTDIDFVVDKCLNSRMVASDKPKLPAEMLIERFIDNPKVDLSTIKGKTDGSTEQNLKRLKDIKDIANTLVNRLRSCGLLSPVFDKKSVYGSEAFCFNTRHEAEIRIVLNEPLSEAQHYKNKEGWQRFLGRGLAKKDGRRKIERTRYDLESRDSLLRQEIAKSCIEAGSIVDKESLCTEIASKFGVSFSEALEVLYSVLPSIEKDLHTDLVEVSTIPEAHLKFEKGLEKVLKLGFPDFSVKHIGQKRRMDKTLTTHDFADICIVTGTKTLVLIDAKATNAPKGYAFAGSEQTKTEHYARYPDQLIAETDTTALECMIIVAPRFSDSAIQKKLKLSATRTNVPFAMITVNELVRFIEQSAGIKNLGKVFLDKIRSKEIGFFEAP